MSDSSTTSAIATLQKPEKERVYHTSKSADELFEAVCSLPEVIESVDGRSSDIKALVHNVSYIVERLESGFRMHCAAVGKESSTTGLRPTLHLVAKFSPIPSGGTQVDLRFRYERTRWALQRVAGLALCTVLGGVWVALGSGVLLDRAIVFGIFLLFVSPVVFRDLRSSNRRRSEQLALLNLVQGAYGGWALPDPTVERSPYRLGGGEREGG